MSPTTVFRQIMSLTVHLVNESLADDQQFPNRKQNKRTVDIAFEKSHLVGDALGENSYYDEVFAKLTGPTDRK